ncbi:MAG: hypothetical protein IKZ51_03185 [Bacteroidales bacterium]|nr:hypothetical protein [Bacteroidales bacterium]
MFLTSLSFTEEMSATGIENVIKVKIDTWFKSGNTIPSTLPETLELLKGWAE